MIRVWFPYGPESPFFGRYWAGWMNSTGDPDMAPTTKRNIDRTGALTKSPGDKAIVTEKESIEFYFTKMVETWQNTTKEIVEKFYDVNTKETVIRTTEAYIEQMKKLLKTDDIIKIRTSNRQLERYLKVVDKEIKPILGLAQQRRAVAIMEDMDKEKISSK